MTAAAPELLRGCESPRLFTRPLRELTPETSLGFSFVAFCEDVLGLHLLPWQRWLAIHALELRPDGRFRFRTVLVLIARQNGKSTFLQALTLWFMWVLRVPMCLIAAQSLEKAEEVWSGAVEMAEGTPDLAAEMVPPIMAAGKKELRTVYGSRCKVQTANRKGGRALTANLVELDELREHHSWDAWAALTKTTMARSNSQVWAASNAGDDLSVVLNDLRENGLRQVDDPDTDFGVFEWSAPDGCATDDRGAWAQANPSLGFTITEESIDAARRTDPDWVFRTEVLCQRVQLGVDSPLPLWPSRLDVSSVVDPDWPLAFAVDVSWDRSTAWIAAAARRPDGCFHLEVSAQGQGTDWVAPWLAARLERWSPVAVCVQQSGAPASTLVDGLVETLGSALVRTMSGPDMAKASGLLYDAVSEATVVHTGQQQLDDAAAVAVPKPLGEAWVFDRKRSAVDVAPLVAVSQALWAIAGWKEPPKRSAPRRLR